MVNEPKKSKEKSARLHDYRSGWSAGAGGNLPQLNAPRDYERGYRNGRDARSTAFMAEIERLKITKAELNRWVLR